MVIFFEKPKSMKTYILPFLFIAVVVFSCQNAESDANSSNNKGSIIEDKEDNANDDVVSSEEFISSTSKYNYDEIGNDDNNKSTGGTAEKEVSILGIDAKLERCLDDEQNSSTAFQIQCIGEAYEKWDDALNYYYKKTRAVYGEKSKAALLKAQRNWIKFRDAEATFLGTMYNNVGGTLYRVIANDDNMNLVKNRTLELAGMSMVGDSYDSKVNDYIGKSFSETYGEDEELNACLERDDSNMGMQVCAGAFAKRCDAKLNEYYKKLRSILNDDEKAKLKAAQLKWLKFRDAELKIYDAIYDDIGGGSLYATEQAFNNAGLLQRRAADLKSYYDVMSQ